MKETVLTADQAALAAQLRDFRENIWPIYQRRGFKDIDLAFNSHLMLQQVSTAEGVALPTGVVRAVPAKGVAVLG